MSESTELTPLEKAVAHIDEITADASEQQQLIAAKCRALMAGYDARWRGAAWVTVSTEEEFHLPLVNPETGAASRTWTHAGKFDGITEYPESGRVYLLEHKTTSDDIADPNSSYWRRLVIDSQVSSYMLANWQMERKLDGTLYDVIRKPGIRPKRITKAEQKMMIQQGEYCGVQVPHKYRLLEAENLELYEVRLTQDCLQNPGKYFQRRVIPRLDDELVEHAAEMWEIGQSLMTAYSKGQHYKNSESCMTWGSPCEYLPICSGHDSPDSDRWHQREVVHSELPIIGEEHDGRSVLTNSRIKCFQTCRRKEFYRYGMGLRRPDENEKESLYMGSVFHEALEVWWNCFTKEESHGDNSRLPASEVGSQHAQA